MKAPAGVVRFLEAHDGHVESVTCQVWLEEGNDVIVELAVGAGWEAVDTPLARQHGDDALRLAGYAGPDRLHKP